MIRGNRENYLLAYDGGDVPNTWQVGVQWASLRQVYHRLDREALNLIASLPDEGVFAADGTAPIRVVHGSPGDVSVFLLPDRDSIALELYRKAGLLAVGYRHLALGTALAEVKEPVLICGHSHIAWHHEQEGRLVLNPGSVGFALDGDPRAHYALLTWQEGRWQAAHRAVPYDLARVRAAFQESGLLAAGGALAWAFLLNAETGRNVPGKLVTHFRRLASQAGFEDFDAIPDTVWEQAVATFDWEAVAEGRS
jgi:diadenosine tetraphosphatase ApaH/serine/threonine PP2A family protein phosphatase